MEEARERARQEVEGLLSWDREQELKQELQVVSEEANRLERELKQLKHNETLGKEVINEMVNKVKKNKVSLKKLSNLWR